MRILFTFAGGPGHFLPMLPIVRAARRRGHHLVVAHRDDPLVIDAVQAEGFTSVPIDAARVLYPGIVPILEVTRDVAESYARDSFGGPIARERVPGLLELIRSWKPDLVVRDEMDYGSAIAAEVAGLPLSTVLVIAAGGLVRADLLAGPLNVLRAEYGLAPDPDLSRLHGDLVFSLSPPRYRDPANPLPGKTLSLRASTPPPPAGTDLNDPPTRSAGRPTVYFTLGTEFNTQSGDLFPRVLSALQNLDIHLIVTVGRQLDPDRFGPQPPNVHIRQYVPQSLLLPSCDLVVSHGGSGSVIGALEHGVPLVLLPLGADQIHNAHRCEDLGVGLSVDAIRADPAQIRSAVESVLAEPGYREAAQQFRAENELLPDADEAVRAMEDLVQTYRNS
ncbi:glycosyltransferase [Kineosporia mesophila]|uniref:Glycosyltransferase n=1 Tax=Kineosporia mesophila TaxID=566012 RepID=A0ABP7A1H5_9ACTN|nr:glycosyltransferase [Kineosporia mesophila]MCD5348921.1 glycosyltransferase [Kineosporia mesophila]